MGESKIKKHNNSFYSQVSNTALTDPRLSLKAKGLYAMITYYLSIPGFVLYKQTLINNSSDGETSFRSAWKELKQAGYLVQHKNQGYGGTYEYEYELLDQPLDSNSIESTCGKSTCGESTSLINPLTKEENTKEGLLNNNINFKNSKETNQSVVVHQEYASEDSHCYEEFSEKVEKYAEDYSRCIDPNIIDTLKELKYVFGVLPANVITNISNLDNDQSIDLLKQAKTILHPSEYDTDILDKNIRNKKGYLIGILKNTYGRPYLS